MWCIQTHSGKYTLNKKYTNEKHYKKTLYGNKKKQFNKLLKFMLTPLRNNIIYVALVYIKRLLLQPSKINDSIHSEAKLK